MTTTTPEASAQAPASSESPVRQKLAAAAARAGTRTTRRKTTPRKAAARKPASTTSRNDRAAARGKHSARIAPAVKSGAALLAWKDPIAGRVIELQADAWAASLDRVAAEDPRVDALLTRISGFFGKGGAWGDFGKETALMVGGVMVATGRVPLTGPGGMVLAMFAGGLVEQATSAVAMDIAYKEAIDAGADPEGAVGINPERLEQIFQELRQQRADKVAARFTPAPADEDEGGDPPADEPAPRTSPFAAWAR